MIKLLIMDVDGTLTDGKIYLTNMGDEIKSFNAKDGYSIKNRLPQMNIIPVIITGRESEIVKKRAEELGIKELYQNVKSKISICNILLKKYNLKFENIASIGDDFNDLEILELCGLSACPNDAIEEVKEKVDIKLSRKGGDGAVYEFISYLLKYNKGEI